MQVEIKRKEYQIRACWEDNVHTLIFDDFDFNMDLIPRIIGDLNNIYNQYKMDNSIKETNIKTLG